jgi:DMSO/TMAO reductase YedYZ molybdopterin-dependent catalytic subunit
VEVDALLVCVHKPIGGHQMGNGRWTVVPLAALLDRAGGVLLARSVDGFTVELPLDVALAHAMVAVGLDGEPLPFRNGFPARLLVPGRYGYAGNVKWLAGLDRRGAARPSGASGYWTSRGWPAGAGRVGPGSRIDVPRAGARLGAGPVTVAGYAWAPPGGVAAVGVSVDQGPWRPAQVADDLSPLSWRAWTYTWNGTPGAHALRVRCRGVDGDQAERDAAPYPHGPAGVHTVPVRVVAEGRTGPLLYAVETLAGLRHAAAGRLRLAIDRRRAWR